MVDELIRDAHCAGYTALAISGGEPLLWSGLRRGLSQAKECGLVTSLTTNGIPLTQRRLGDLTGLLDVLAISLDGMPTAHDRMRNSVGAFSRMAARLPELRASGIPFGFLFTLTNTNLHELPWIAEFAIDEGAALLQIHPLEEVGRARGNLEGNRPHEITTNAAYLSFLRLREKVKGRLQVQLDLAHRDVLRAEPWRAHAGARKCGVLLSDLVEQLIVEADGTVVPMQHGFPRIHAIGSLYEARLSVLASRWRPKGYRRYRNHCAQVAKKATSDPEALPAFNWHELIATSVPDSPP